MRNLNDFKKQTFLFLLIAVPLSIWGQKITISGYIKDAQSGESLIGANVFVTHEKSGTVANEYGFYSITIKPTDTIRLVFSFIGYTPQAKALTANSDLKLDIFLSENSKTLSEVIVSSKRNDDNVQKAQVGVMDIPIHLLQNLPAIAGEKDVLKIIQLLPGVQSGSEGTTGFYVRGGSVDQNLVQLDEATVYNPSHLFGLFSTFNTRAINSVTLVKGGFGAQYGGRLSSILALTMKEGNNQTFHTEGGIGLISAQGTVEGPIFKGKGSFIISARRSHADLLLRPFLPDTNRTSYYFYDFNAKANYQISPKDKVFLSVFNGRDKAQYTDASSLNYGLGFGNTTGTLRWNHLFSNKFFANTSLIYNDYSLGLPTTQSGYLAQIHSGINDINFKSDFSYFVSPKQTIKAGFNYVYHTFTPISTSSRIPRTGQVATIRPDSAAHRYAHEGAIYISDEWNINQILSFNVGARLPIFYGNGGQYVRFEPRTTLKVGINPTASLKASYTEMNQFLHLVPNSSASLPTDVWVPSSKVITPQLSRQVSLGFFKNYKENEYETSLEAYYKTMHNQVLFKEGTKLTEQSNFDQSLTFGNGESYGLELFIHKNTGRLTGWISYTLSKTTQKFAELNRGIAFPAAYDKRHNLSVVGDYKLSKHWSVAADWVFTTGGAFTLPVGRFNVLGDVSLFDGVYLDYTSRNNYRYKNYHRLDVNFIYKKTKTWWKRPTEIEWTLGAYNVYSRLNPYFIYLTIDQITGKPTAKQVALLPIVPNVSWNFKF